MRTLLLNKVSSIVCLILNTLLGLGAKGEEGSEARSQELANVSSFRVSQTAHYSSLSLQYYHILGRPHFTSLRYIGEES
jgi:hypothetical protein